MSNEKLTVVTELHKPARKNYPRRCVHMRGIDETWQADLVEMLPYALENNGCKCLLTVIDIFSPSIRGLSLLKARVSQTLQQQCNLY